MSSNSTRKGLDHPFKTVSQKTSGNNGKHHVSSLETQSLPDENTILLPVKALTLCSYLSHNEKHKFGAFANMPQNIRKKKKFFPYEGNSNVKEK